METVVLDKFLVIGFGSVITILLGVIGASATMTFPAAWKCWAEGIASGNNTLSLSGTSGDVYVLPWIKVDSRYYVASKNSNR